LTAPYADGKVEQESCPSGNTASAPVPEPRDVPEELEELAGTGATGGEKDGFVEVVDEILDDVDVDEDVDVDLLDVELVLGGGGGGAGILDEEEDEKVEEDEEEEEDDEEEDSAVDVVEVVDVNVTGANV